MRNMDLVELAPGVRPTRDLIDRTMLVEMMKACIGISLQGALEVLQMLLRMLAFSIGGVREPHGGRS